MRKFLFKDTDEGVEVIEKEDVRDDEFETKEDIHDDDALTPEEISALKALAANADKIIKLLEVEAREHAATSDEDEDEDESKLDDEDEEKLDDEEEEEIVVKSNDSVRSFGSIAKKRKAVDSIEANDIETAWAKRYGG